MWTADLSPEREGEGGGGGVTGPLPEFPATSPSHFYTVFPRLHDGLWVSRGAAVYLLRKASGRGNSIYAVSGKLLLCGFCLRETLLTENIEPGCQ